MCTPRGAPKQGGASRAGAAPSVQRSKYGNDPISDCVSSDPATYSGAGRAHHTRSHLSPFSKPVATLDPPTLLDTYTERWENVWVVGVST